MPLSQMHAPRSHRARPRRRHAGAAPAAAGRRAVRRPPLLPALGPRRPAALYAGAAGLALLLTLVVAGRAGALTRMWAFLDFGAGVLSLVSLTATVLWGLMATDRLVLGSGHRLLAQGVHRGLAVAGLGFLVLHVWVKVAENHTGAASVVVPFADRDRPLLIGLGTLAGYLFLGVAVSGAARSAFATTRSRSRWWRAVHTGAYPAWCASLVHGLKSGRSADGWVTVAYAMCLLAVAVLLALRLRSRLRRSGAARPAAAAPPTAARAAAARPAAAPPPPPPMPPSPPPPAQPPFLSAYIPSPAAASEDSATAPGRWP
ncbi:hypothetical protein [Streptomyces venezuelae]|uniref:hypothetical protein n=1 Tax=Streptomyces venezuelae TaxID=54571 RepID=UPI001CC2595C|nr:hypothetical protein [Streptomyces venezuelae]